MTVEFLKNLSLISYILSAMFVIVSVVLFFVFDIKKIIGDLSGANARKAIENIQKQNESGKETIHRTHRGNSSTKSTANKMSSPKAQPVQAVNRTAEAENFLTMELDATAPLVQEQAWDAVNETTVLETPAFFVLEVEMGFLGSSERIE